MQFKYSPSTKGFFLEGLHSEIPEDAIPVSKERHAELMTDQSNGKIITVVDGEVVSIERPGPTSEEVEFSILQKRQSLLEESDWIVIRSTETNTSIPQEWLDYRQALRDITTQPGFPLDVTFPVKPSV